MKKTLRISQTIFAVGQDSRASGDNKSKIGAVLAGVRRQTRLSYRAGFDYDAVKIPDRQVNLHALIKRLIRIHPLPNEMTKIPVRVQICGADGTIQPADCTRK